MRKTLSLSDLITTHLSIAKNSNTFAKVLQQLCYYIVGAKGAFELQHDLKKTVDFTALDISAKSFRLLVVTTDRAMIGLKFYMLNVIKGNYTTYQETVSLAKQCGIDLTDAKLAYAVVNKSKYSLRRVAYIRALTPTAINPDNLATLEAKFSPIYKDVMKTVRSVVFKKLRFVSNSTNTEFSDFHSDLTVKMLQVFYLKMPTTMSDAHILSYMRQAMGNETVNLIKRYTSKKRGRLIGTGKDGFGANRSELLVTSENQLNVHSDSEDTLEYDSLMAWDIQVTTMHSAEIEFSIQQVLERYKHLRNKSRLLRILLGQEDAAFTVWLHKTKYITASDLDNVDFQTKSTPKKFKRALTTYFKLEDKQLDDFLDNVKQQFTGPTPVNNVIPFKVA